MSIGMMPLETLPVNGLSGVCSTCVDPEHAPSGKGVDHPFTMRVKPVGYVASLLPDDCTACAAPVEGHAEVDIDLACNIVACERQRTV